MNLSTKGSGDKKKPFYTADLSLSLLKHFVPGCKARVQSYRGGDGEVFFFCVFHCIELGEWVEHVPMLQNIFFSSFFFAHTLFPSRLCQMSD